MNSPGVRKILLTREELYARVWSVPLLQLAREFGISDVALGRMCRRRNIPCPPPGYWAKRRAGRPPPRPLLPPPEGKIGRPALFTVSPSGATASEPLPAAKPEIAGFSLEQMFVAASEWDRWDRVRRYLDACEQQWLSEGALSPPRRIWLARARHELGRMPSGLATATATFANTPTLGQRPKWATASA
ncbi:hypothetical protein [Oleiharenicola sp. Vm1]|uniref:hypothetical protein n=1 Tax=Oleiharenicola sp. Vm1 TaxID=3398393 RepID=UPI0039F50E1C